MSLILSNNWILSDYVVLKKVHRRTKGPIGKGNFSRDFDWGSRKGYQGFGSISNRSSIVITFCNIGESVSSCLGRKICLVKHPNFAIFLFCRTFLDVVLSIPPVCIFNPAVLFILYDFPISVAAPIFADNQSLSSQPNGETLYRTLRLAYLFSNLLLCYSGVWLNDFQYSSFVQNVIFRFGAGFALSDSSPSSELFLYFSYLGINVFLFISFF